MNTQLKHRNMEDGRFAGMSRKWEELVDERLLEDEDTQSICILASHEFEQNGPSYAA